MKLLMFMMIVGFIKVVLVVFLGVYGGACLLFTVWALVVLVVLIGSGDNRGGYAGESSYDDMSDVGVGNWSGEYVDGVSEGHDVCEGNVGDVYAGLRVMGQCF